MHLLHQMLHERDNMKITNTFTLIIFLTVLSCSNSWTSRELVQNVTSSDNLVDALVYKTNAGATSSFCYELFIVPHGKKTDFKDVLFRADHVKGLSVEWKSDRILNIIYDESRIFHFMNFWQSRDVHNFSYVVELRLSPTSDKHSLSEEDRWVKKLNFEGKEVIPGLPNGLP